MVSTRALAVGGVVGPAAFVGAWVACGIATPGYSPVTQAISELAALGAPTRWVMTAGFVIFAAGVSCDSFALRRVMRGRAWIAALVCAIATLGVAAVPLGWFSDGLHGMFAGVGYVALALTPVLSARQLARRGLSRVAAVSLGAGVMCAVCLVAVTFTPAHGLFQRLGLFTGDAWLVASAIAIVTGRLEPADG